MQQALPVRYARILGAITTGVTTAVLVAGWALDVEFLRSVFPGLATMKPNTALGMAAAGAGLYLLSDDTGGWRRRAGHALALLSALVGSITLAEYAFDWDAGIDALLLPRSALVVVENLPGRPSPNTALGILLTAVGLLTLNVRVAWLLRVAELMGLGAVIIGVLGLLGYVFGVQALYAVNLYSSMAIHTAALLVLLGIGVIASRPGHIIVQFMLDAGPGGQTVRRLLPAALALPPATAALQVLGVNAGLFPQGFGLALLTTTIIIFSGLILWTAVSVRTADDQRREAQNALHLANLDLEERVENRTAAVLRESAERRDSEGRFRELFESAADAVIISDSDGRIVLVNRRAEQLFGYSGAEMNGKPVEILIPEAVRERHVHHRAGYVAAPRPRPMGAGLELVGRRKDGSLLPIDVSISHQETRSGIQITTILRDVTERKQAQDALRQYADQLESANRELESFSYSVAHDLRAPLRAINGFSGALVEEHADSLDPSGVDYLMRVQRAGERMGHLIDDLLMLSRVTRTELTLEQVDVSALAADVVRGLKRDNPHRQVRIVIEPGLAARADKRLLRIVLENLFANAWKFTAGVESVCIGFHVHMTDGERTFSLQDNGVGFDMADAGRMFSAFQRLHEESSFPGSGIGLATVKRIINKHGGRVWSEGVAGQGATLYFTLGQGEKH